MERKEPVRSGEGLIWIKIKLLGFLKLLVVFPEYAHVSHLFTLRMKVDGIKAKLEHEVGDSRTESKVLEYTFSIILELIGMTLV